MTTLGTTAEVAAPSAVATLKSHAFAARLVGLDDQRVDMAMMRTPDGHGRIEGAPTSSGTVAEKS
ncbi:hypothetical protein AB0L65_35910 [Nonomuraea sp. NPDC052116]|uniref:hypothetical protein n=1 Tax=Nonomuraea sp. NPDC052116 TaxID=3155665 RepID=UPI00341774D0